MRKDAHMPGDVLRSDAIKFAIPGATGRNQGTDNSTRDVGLVQVLIARVCAEGRKSRSQHCLLDSCFLFGSEVFVTEIDIGYCIHGFLRYFRSLGWISCAGASCPPSRRVP